MNGSLASDTREVCPVCGKHDVTEQWQVQVVPFGIENPVELQVNVPVLTCQSCGFSFTDDRAAALRHDEACRYQGLTTPGEIKRVREDVYRMSRRDFEKSFGISEASLERWENRKLFPSRQASIYLRLLSDPEIGRRAMEAPTHHQGRLSAGIGSDVSVESRRFRELVISAAVLTRAKEFKLRPMLN